MNNTTTYQHEHDKILTIGEKIHVAVLCLVMAASLFGNILVITAISRTKSLRTLSNFLVINLSVCDMLTSFSGITFTLIVYNMYCKLSFPYGQLGCNVLWPATTYTANCSAFTLAVIAMERYFQISSRVPNRNAIGSKRKVIFLFTGIHGLAMTSVVPYVGILKYEIYENHAYCYENWNEQWHMQAYTVSLFLVQYMCPLATMAVFHLLSWRSLHMHLKLLKEFDHSFSTSRRKGKKASETSLQSTAFMNSDNIDSMKGRAMGKRVSAEGESKDVMRRHRLSNALSSPIIGKRKHTRAFNATHKLSIKILKMFTVIFIVFACCALPHQLHWLLLVFAHLPPSVSNVLILLTYVNHVINSWVYAGFHDGIRKAYVRLLCRKSCSRESEKQETEHREHANKLL